MIKKLGDVTMIKLSDSDSNIYVIGNNVIDSGTGFNFTRLMYFFSMMRKPMNSVEWVINTHGHFDHVGGNGYFLNAKVAIHELDAPIIEKADVEMAVADFFDGKMHPRKVDMKFRDGQAVQGLKVIHTPGHTPGSVCLYDEKRKILFSGDTVFADGVGRTDMPGGNEEQLKKSLQKLKGLDIKALLPGHGLPVMQNVKLALDKINENFY